MDSEKRLSKKELRRRKNKRLRLILAMEFIVFAVLLVSYGVYYIVNKMNKLNYNDLSDEDIEVNDILNSNSDKYTTIALFGGDSREGALDKGTHSDCIMIASINNETKEVKIVSVYRDTFLEIAKDDPDCEKATHAYFVGGPECAINTLNRNLDLEIKDYVMVDFTAMTMAINDLGGVTVGVESNELPTMNLAIQEQIATNGIQSPLVNQTGMLKLNGVQATAYARIRSTDLGDITRTERQREVVSAMIDEAKQSDLSTLNDVIDDVFPNISTSISQSEIIALAAAMMKYELGETTGFPYEYAAPTLGNKGSVIVPTNLEDNVIMLHNFLYGTDGYVPSSTVKRISGDIENETGLTSTIDLSTLEGTSTDSSTTTTTQQ